VYLNRRRWQSNYNQISDLFPLQILEESNLEDEARFGTLIKDLAGSLGNSVVAAGHQYAMLTASSLVSKSAAHQESHSGLTFLSTLTQIAQNDIRMGLKNVKKVCHTFFSGHFTLHAQLT